MYANTQYRLLFLNPFNGKDVELPDPPKQSDSLSIGLYEWARKAAEDSGLSDTLGKVFGSDDAQQILDMAIYMMSRESAVMQHYPAWARDHVLFSDSVRNDTDLGRFLRDNLTISKIKQFKLKWAVQNLADGKIYLCYDSTNVNCQAEGVFLVQKGHAKDDPALPQVNTDYVIRQSDGLPLTYMHSPGSVSDIVQAQEMLDFFKKICKLAGTGVKIVLICDRGYISVKNLKKMKESGIEYILMLRSNFNAYCDLASKYTDELKSYKNKLKTSDGDEKFGLTRTCVLYDGAEESYAHIIWSEDLYRSKRDAVGVQINEKRKALELFIQNSKDKCLEVKEFQSFQDLFNLKLEESEPKIIQKKRGRGFETISIPTYKLLGFEDNEEAINREYVKCGIYILVSSEPMTAQEAVNAYSKRDCVEKAFQALKSHLGMDKIGVTTEEAMHGKGLIWFVASILHALLFNGTESLRITDKKHYTIPAMVDILEALKADKDLSDGTYRRRYKVTKRQNDILRQWKIDESLVDEWIADKLNPSAA